MWVELIEGEDGADEDMVVERCGDDGGICSSGGGWTGGEGPPTPLGSSGLFSSSEESISATMLDNDAPGETARKEL